MKRKSKGFTLLEVLLAVILFAVGFIALWQAMSVGLFAGSENENELVAVNLAQEKIEELRNKDYAAISNETKAVVAGFPAFAREAVITIPQTSLKQVSVNVYWYSKSNELNASVVTYLSDI